MKKDSTLNMTVGSPAKLLTLFALPMLLGNIFQQAYNLTDSIVVGKFLGANSLAAIGATGSVTFLFFSISNGIGSGCGIVTSQLFGAGNKDKVRQSIANSAYIMFLASLIMATAAYLLAPYVLLWMQTPAEVYPESLTYIRMSCIGVPLIVVYNYSASMLRALGDSRTPLYFLIFSCILNIFIDILFVRFLGMGVFGAALATVISQMIAGSGCLIFALCRNPYFKLTKEDWKLNPRILKRSIQIGLPLAMQWSMISISTMGLQSFVNTFGPTTMAAYTSVARVESLLHQPFSSMSNALSTYSGQNYGANKTDRIRKGVLQGGLMAGIFALVLLLAFIFFNRNIISIFIDDPDVIAIGGKALILSGIFCPFLVLIYVTRGTLNGIGDATFSFINGTVEIIFRIALPRLLFLIPGLGMWSIWLGNGLTWGISSLFCVLRYKGWMRKRSASNVSLLEQKTPPLLESHEDQQESKT